MGVREISKGGLRRLISGAAVAAAALIGTTGAASAEGLFQWSDTFVGFRYGASFQEPANTHDVEKIIGQFQHVSGWKYGTNFINVDLLYDLYKDDEADHGPDARQNKEIYAVFRETLSSSKIFGATYGGFIRDIGLTFGGDLSYKDDDFNARVRKFVIGPSVEFEVPGFWNLGILLGTEHNHNGIGLKYGIPGVKDSVEFDPTWRIETAWGIPLPLDIATPVTFKGFMDIIGPKGKDGFGNETTTEVLLETALMFDVGAPMNLPKTVYLGVGYQWWKNKFGNDPKFTTPGTEASVPEFVAEVHF